MGPLQTAGTPSCLGFVDFTTRQTRDKSPKCKCSWTVPETNGFHVSWVIRMGGGEGRWGRGYAGSRDRATAKVESDFLPPPNNCCYSKWNSLAKPMQEVFGKLHCPWGIVHYRSLHPLLLSRSSKMSPIYWCLPLMGPTADCWRLSGLQKAGVKVGWKAILASRNCIPMLYPDPDTSCVKTVISCF